MTLWKPLALASTTALVLLVGYQAANAGSAKTDAPSVSGAQPNMETALVHLRDARASLEKAEHNKGGWRVKAIESTEIAIKETQRGIAFADKSDK
jgi:hypothetical protein